MEHVVYDREWALLYFKADAKPEIKKPKVHADKEVEDYEPPSRVWN